MILINYFFKLLTSFTNCDLNHHSTLTFSIISGDLPWQTTVVHERDLVHVPRTILTDRELDSRKTQRGVEKEQCYFSSVRQKDCALEEGEGPDP